MSTLSSQLTSIRCATALTPSGWQRNCVIKFDQSGRIESIRENDDSAVDLCLEGTVIAGIPNLHSHAHQKVITGRAEHRVAGQDDFWGWRELMYRANASLNPEQLQTIATYLYIDMLQKGYTAVAEFHYLHHRPDGAPYADRSEMSARLLNAASEAGIAITLLPVLYCRGGFNNEPVQHAQHRFYNRSDDYLSLLEDCHSLCGKNPDRSLGFAAHSLRAVSPSDISTTIDNAGDMLEGAPIHLHIAEQIREVNDCVEINGARPVAWLYDQCEVTDRWCLVHATHVDPDEQMLLAKSGAIIGLCPTTEANLGDGIFPAATLMANNGFLGVGSDSQVCTSPAEELRLLEYGQRLSLQRRTVLVPDGVGSNGRALITAAITGGNRARGERVSGLQPGARGDLIEIGSDHPEFSGRTPDQVLDTWIFSGPDNPVQNVVVGGKHVVHDGVHPLMKDASESYREMIDTLDLT